MNLTREDINTAMDLVKTHHSGQIDRGGDSYINHILRVFKSVGGFNSKPIELGIVALLHDIVEDTSVQQSTIYKLFGTDVGDAVKVLTKKGETDEQYLKKIKSNKIARIVKIADMIDNSNINRIKNPNQIDIDRVLKYKKAIKFLK